jgi:uncharacterized repeat protein (TIGR03843 family)
LPLLRQPDGSEGAHLSGDERALEALNDPLASGDLEVLGLMPNASNAAVLVRLQDGSLAVYKPRRGETPLWDFPEGSLCNREVAAYVVSRELGWPDIPHTVLREGPLGPGAVQTFIDFDPQEHFFTLVERMPEVFRRFALFDLVVNNADRKSGHCLLGADGRVWGIDHGVCFHEEPKLRTVIWDFAGEPVEESLASDLSQLERKLDEPALREELLSLIAPGELDALRIRLRELLSARIYPEPGRGRPFPWPLV